MLDKGRMNSELLRVGITSSNPSRWSMMEGLKYRPGDCRREMRPAGRR